MQIIQPSVEILSAVDGHEVLKRLEIVGRTCYKSENLITDTSAETFVRKLIARGHEAIIEHESISVRFICDRGVSHELVRHRVASYAQESQRFCNYSQDKFGGEITVIKPCFLLEGTEAYRQWEWTTDLRQRCSKAAHPQMREVMLMLLEKLHSLIPVVFDDIYEEYLI